MGPEEKYLFDLWGYVNIENVLGTDALAELNALIDAQDYPNPVDEDVYSQRFGGFLNWGERCVSQTPESSTYYAVLSGDRRSKIPAGSCLRYLDDRGKSGWNASWWRDTL